MTFEERQSEAKKLVVNFLADFVAPRGVGDDGLANRIRFIAEAFARKMPVKGDYAEAVSAVLLKLRDTHESNTWPAQAAFVMAMPSGEVKQFAQLQSFSPDRRQMLSDRMNSGESVPEPAIWGAIGSSLSLNAGVMESYRKASVQSWLNAYRNEAYSMMAQRYGDQVSMYFPLDAAE